jgi:hypothetical protein
MNLPNSAHVLPVIKYKVAEKLDELLTPINVSNELKKIGERQSPYIQAQRKSP